MLRFYLELDLNSSKNHTMDFLLLLIFPSLVVYTWNLPRHPESRITIYRKAIKKKTPPALLLLHMVKDCSSGKQSGTHWRSREGLPFVTPPSPSRDCANTKWPLWRGPAFLFLFFVFFQCIPLLCNYCKQLWIMVKWDGRPWLAGCYEKAVKEICSHIF